VDEGRVETNTIAATYAAPNTAQASVCHTAEPQRAAATGPYQRSHASRRWVTSRPPMPSTRTSFPAAAVVASVNRCRLSRDDCAPSSCAARSTPGRHVEVTTVGSAKSVSSANAGWIDASSVTVTPRRRIHPAVENTDMYM